MTTIYCRMFRKKKFMCHGQSAPCLSSWHVGIAFQSQSGASYFQIEMEELLQCPPCSEASEQEGNRLSIDHDQYGTMSVLWGPKRGSLVAHHCLTYIKTRLPLWHNLHKLVYCTAMLRVGACHDGRLIQPPQKPPTCWNCRE